MPPLKKPEKIDGLSPKDLAKIRSAIRVIWQRSHARKLCLKRATDADGWYHCEKCLKISPKVYVDHIVPAGALDAGFIERLFCPSNSLQCLCATCHKIKTNLETNSRRVSDGTRKRRVSNAKPTPNSLATPLVVDEPS